jgi:hypothetical protein
VNYIHPNTESRAKRGNPSKQRILRLIIKNKIRMYLLLFLFLIFCESFETNEIVEAAWSDPNIVCCQKKPDGTGTYWYVCGIAKRD